MRKIELIKDGNLTSWAQSGLMVIGFLMIYSAVKFESLPKVLALALFVLGLPVAAVGGYSARAHMLGLKPFDDSYEKARRSYDVKDENGKPVCDGKTAPIHDQDRVAYLGQGALLLGFILMGVGRVFGIWPLLVCGPIIMFFGGFVIRSAAFDDSYKTPPKTFEAKDDVDGNKE